MLFPAPVIVVTVPRRVGDGRDGVYGEGVQGVVSAVEAERSEPDELMLIGICSVGREVRSGVVSDG